MTPIKDAIFIQALECTIAETFASFDDEYVRELVDGGVTAINETVASPRADFNEIIRKSYEFMRRCDELDVLVTTTVSDIERAHQEGKLAVILGLQHLPFYSAISPDDLGFIYMLHRIGFRIAQLTYQRRNLLGDGCGEKIDNGLSNFGIQVVAEMNRLGMVIDLSHVGPKSTLDAIEVSEDPVIFSHANCRSLCNNVRNKTDEQIKALAEKDGVIGISSFSLLLRLEQPPTFTDYLDHITHVIDLVGVNYVGIGFDTSNKVPVHPKIDMRERRKEVTNYPKIGAPSWYLIPTENAVNRHRIEELRHASHWRSNIANGLSDRGYSAGVIRKILGTNFLRIFQKVWEKQQ